MNDLSTFNSKLYTPFLLISLFFLVACSIGGTTRPAQFYILDVATPTNIAGLKNLHMGIGPIVIPGYINRPQIATKSDSAEISYAEFARWAEPMGEMFTRTLTQSVISSTGSNHIFSHPWGATVNPKYKLTAKILKFENDSRGDAVLIVQWQLINSSSAQSQLAQYSEFNAAAKSTTYPDRVAALNETIKQFSQLILSQIDKA